MLIETLFFHGFMHVVYAGMHWGLFKPDGCTGYKTRQYSAILWEIPSDWQDTCYKTGAQINDQWFPKPDNCAQDSNGRMWGEFKKVYDENCEVGGVQWDRLQVKECVSVGKRKYLSRLLNISGDWMTACKNTPALINGKNFITPDNCDDKGAGGMWGEFYVDDISCDPGYGLVNRKDIEDFKARLVSGSSEIPLCENCDVFLSEWPSDGCSDGGTLLDKYHSLFYPACVAHDMCGTYAITYNVFNTKNQDRVTEICARMFQENMYVICKSEPGALQSACRTSANIASDSVGVGGISGYRAVNTETKNDNFERNIGLFYALMTRASLFTSVGTNVEIKSGRENYDVRIYSPNMNYFYAVSHKASLDVFSRYDNPWLLINNMIGKSNHGLDVTVQYDNVQYYSGRVVYGNPPISRCAGWKLYKDVKNYCSNQSMKIIDGGLYIYDYGSLAHTTNLSDRKNTRLTMKDDGTIETQSFSLGVWGELQAEHCIKLNIRQYSSVLWSIPLQVSQEYACNNNPVTINGQQFSGANMCVYTDKTWGQFYVKDDTCVEAGIEWGVPQVRSCSGAGKRKYSAILWNASSKENWKELCEKGPNMINGQSFTGAVECSKADNVWGNFYVNDISCDSEYGLTSKPEVEDYNIRLVSGTIGLPLCENCDSFLTYARWYGAGCSASELNNLLYPACIAHGRCTHYAIYHNFFNTNGYSNKDIETEIVTNVCASLFKTNLYKICESALLPIRTDLGNEINADACKHIADAMTSSVQFPTYKASTDRDYSLNEEKEGKIFKAISTRAVLFTSVSSGFSTKVPSADKAIRIYSPDMRYFLSLTNEATIDVFKYFETTQKHGKVVYEPAPIPSQSLEYVMSLTDDGMITISKENNIILSKNLASLSGSKIQMSLDTGGNIQVVDKIENGLLVEVRMERFELGHIPLNASVPYSWNRPGDVFTHVPTRFEQDMQISCGDKSCDRREFVWTVPGSYKPKWEDSSACTEKAYDVKVTCAWGGEYKDMNTRNMLYDLIKSITETSAKNLDEGRDACINGRKASPGFATESECYTKAACQSVTEKCEPSKGLCINNGQNVLVNTDDLCTGNYDCYGRNGRFVRLTFPKTISVRWYHSPSSFSFLRFVCSSERVNVSNVVLPNIDCANYNLLGFVPEAIKLSGLTEQYGKLDIRCYG